MDTKKKTHYVDNAAFLAAMKEHAAAVKEAKATGTELPRVSEFIGECFLRIATHLSYKANFVNYTYREDMISDGIENCLHRDTKILTQEYGNVPIGSIVNHTVTVKSRDGVWRPAQVQSFGPQMLYRYRFGSFNTPVDETPHEVIATANHRWFVKNRRDTFNRFTGEFGVVDNLRVGDWLEPAVQTTPHVDGVVHGLIFGDGSINQKVSYTPTTTVTQGHEYPFMRVCKQDRVRDEIVSILTNAGYVFTNPPSADGDPVFYLGRKLGLKQLPFTRDPEYIHGFIHGWWLADGNKTTTTRRLQISTVRKDAVQWVQEHAAFGGYVFMTVRETAGSQTFGGDHQPLYTITLAPASEYDARVRHIELYGIDEVFCVVEPITQGFVLGNGLLTGNCLTYVNNFNPDKSSNPFGYFTTIMAYAFIRRIQREKKHTYIKYRMLEKAIIDGAAEFDMPVDSSMLTFDNVTDFIKGFEDYTTRRRDRRKRAKEDRLALL